VAGNVSSAATSAVGHADLEAIRQTVFDWGSLFRTYHSVNTDINKRIRSPTLGT
jgi:hypothetical protein